MAVHGRRDRPLALAQQRLQPREQRGRSHARSVQSPLAPRAPRRGAEGPRTDCACRVPRPRRNAGGRPDSGRSRAHPRPCAPPGDEPGSGRHVHDEVTLDRDWQDRRRPAASPAAVRASESRRRGDGPRRSTAPDRTPCLANSPSHDQYLAATADAAPAADGIDVDAERTRCGKERRADRGKRPRLPDGVKTTSEPSASLTVRGVASGSGPTLRVGPPSAPGATAPGPALDGRRLRPAARDASRSRPCSWDRCR